ncbi:MAG: bifunctional sugar-1-phosphate nucleotidylyltransferase/acetyltransferase [Candidatus Thorarchaeota archaeon]|jgi:bifunctional UDP-N-acetylglucosamine pyrophosphorylase/glucosamine-1-phosphate N-acetyltransferase
MKKAALMAAGNSTRMLPLSANIPKHLLPVAGQPFIFHTLRALREAGVKETLVIYGYRGEELQKSIDAHDWGKMSISYVLQSERKGTAHAAGYARDFAGSDDILLMNGDVMTGPDTYKGLIENSKKNRFDMTLTVFPIKDPSVYGVVAVEDGKATELIEKPRSDQMVSNLVNAGIYAVGQNLWDAIDKTKPSKRGELEITDSIKMLIDENKVGAYTIPSWWLEIGKPWDLLEANKTILSNAMRRIEGTVEEGAVIKGNTIVEAGAVIKAGAYIEGPVYIGEEAVVGPNCYIRAYTALGRKVKIGNAVEVKNSIVMDETNIGHLSYVGDSIIGRKSNFGAGTITANLRHDDKPVLVSIKGERVNSGRRKLGAIIADDVKTGIGTSLAPGVVLHQGARTGVGVIVDRDVHANTLVSAIQEKTVTDLKSQD